MKLIPLMINIPKLDILNISTETIKKKLDNLKIDKSPGPDNT
jgi:hypothetical protein